MCHDGGGQRGGRDGEDELGAGAGDAVGPDGAAVQLDKFFAEFETDSGAFFLHEAGGGEDRVREDVSGFGDAGARVADDDGDEFLRRGQIDVDGAAGRRVFDGVGDEVADDAAQEVGVGVDKRFFRDIVGKFNFLMSKDGQVHVGRVGHEFAKRVFAFPGVDTVQAGAGPLKEVVHQMECVLRGFVEGGEAFLDLIGGHFPEFFG